MSGPESQSAPGNTPPAVAFLNEPQEKAKPLKKNVESYLKDNNRYAGKNLTIEFSDDGASSLLAFIGYDGARKEALKIPMKPEHDVGIPAAFRAWEQVGVAVPRVLEDGVIDGRPYTLMEYIDAGTVQKNRSTEELLASEWFVGMGKTLRCMHQAKGAGYGNLDKDSNGALSTFDEWLNLPLAVQRDSYVRKHALIDSGILDAAREKLSAYAENAETVICHNDYSISNIFDTNPPTVFDPAPELNAPLVDLGKTIMNSAPFDDAVIEQIIRGYESGDSVSGIPPITVDRGILFAAFVVTAVRNKIVNKHEDGPDKPASVERVKGLQDYIEKHKDLLNG